MNILKVNQNQADQVGYIVCSYDGVDGIPATQRNRNIFPDAEIIEVESETTIDYFEGIDQQIEERIYTEAEQAMRETY